MASQRRAKHRSRKKPPLENEIREILVRAFGFGFGFGVVVAVAAVYLHSSTFVPTSSVLQCHIRLHRFVASLRNEPSTPPRPAPSRQGPRNPFFVLSARHENRRGSYFGLGAAPRRPAQPSPMPIEKHSAALQQSETRFSGKARRAALERSFPNENAPSCSFSCEGLQKKLLRRDGNGDETEPR
ncbi:hypothetical protein V9T40_013096 [Parthenolecanium corni]|uniref:Transmembrane protein n=1 Tax=Parthenolecanium corni TaxID=536013 RepID=A0AAN9TMV4_9HEMI